MKNFLAEFKTSLLLTLVLVVLLCGAYPLAVWAGAQVLFPAKANGSLLVDANGTVRGSALLAQNFSSDKYFQPRPSAAGTGFDATSSGGTNLGPTSAKLANGSHAKDASGKDVNDPGNFDGIKDLVAAYRASNGLTDNVPVPADAVTRSGSGLDPHISLANAQLQAPRVARARGLALAQIQPLIAQSTAGPDLGILGEPGVNVLLLNTALDRIPSGK
jgi:K+-transporting ATPase ATPase C chain